ncbi:ABC transporter permease [Aeromicrobium sp. CF4.19]|uniref:ABC transporter permease n=1 Tax=Aeromicrobium sp. CF4.19 TaxID=3373082 RepID=UPI003EE6ACC6
MRVRSFLVGLLPPVVAVGAAMIATSLVIVVTGGSAIDFLTTLFSLPQGRVLVDIVNQTSMLALAGFAAAICFRMGLFNIGVEGQYIIGSCAGAFFAVSGILGGFANIFGTLVVAVLAGAGWALIAGLLKVYRGVSEVISAIMLNYVALTLANYLVRTYGESSGYARTVGPLPASSQPLGFSVLPDAKDIWALAVLAVIVAVGYWFLLERTRFGFNLRATGESSSAATAGGIDARRMVLATMAISGAIAGLVWMPSFFGSTLTFGIPENFQTNLGFTGLAVALLGRNRSAGILVGALLFAYLAAQSNGLQRVGIATEIIGITQGVVVLAVVIAYEVVARRRRRAEQTAVAEQLGTVEDAKS